MYFPKLISRNACLVIYGLCCPVFYTHAQEFQTYANGLIYSDTTIKQLRHTLDSLATTRQKCTSGIQWSLEQGLGNYFTLWGEEAVKALHDIRAGADFAMLSGRYPDAEKETGLWLIKTAAEKDGNRLFWKVSNMKIGTLREWELYIPMVRDSFSREERQWIFNYDTLEKTLQAFYVVDNWKVSQLPQEYSEMIAYADCTLDSDRNTFARVYDIWETAIDDHAPLKDELALVMNYIRDTLHLGKEWYPDQVATWQMEALERDRTFKDLLKTAAEKAFLHPEYLTNEAFEEIVARYYNPVYAMEMKRRRWVVGNCSDDERPRKHALMLAKLAAASGRWDVFLKAHLDLMNDNFLRITDGSYAWPERKTYIRELEALNIDVQGLLLGTLLVSREMRPGHYQGRLFRLGRALAEVTAPRKFEDRLLAVIADEQLDMVNRIKCCSLFLAYNKHMKPEKQNTNKARLQAAIASFPGLLRDKVLSDESGE